MAPHFQPHFHLLAAAKVFLDAQCHWLRDSGTQHNDFNFENKEHCASG